MDTSIASYFDHIINISVLLPVVELTWYRVVSSSDAPSRLCIWLNRKQQTKQTQSFLERTTNSDATNPYRRLRPKVQKIITRIVE
ncbi:hypothetical protein VTL71DRAFT_3214 [Oculimacula yallundae]|uniref:Uncharacterized protein n=1 Tax=Oculimacula yallundae TaxID=86028 RepID=A0ABR4C6H4_9HELO